MQRSLRALAAACALLAGAGGCSGTGAGAGSGEDHATELDAGADAQASPGMGESAGGDAGGDSRDESSADGGAPSGDADASSDLWINPAGCNGGGAAARFRGVPAYCQPPGTTSADGYYQCDELANRFMRDALAHPNLDNVVTEYASSICGKAAAMAAYSVWGPSYRSTQGQRPVAGDLVVFTGTPGHVAVVVDASSPDAVQIMQQNALPPVAVLGWDSQSAFFTQPSAECWVHAEPAPPAQPPAGASCGCFDGDGDYCGLSIVDHEWWYGCQADAADGPPAYDTLYACANGTFTPKQTCGGQCLTMFEQPATGACLPSPQSDPCAGVPSSASGDYCGGSNQNGFAGGDPGTLYDCVDGAAVAVQTCPAGCATASPGQPDHCK